MKPSNPNDYFITKQKKFLKLFCLKIMMAFSLGITLGFCTMSATANPTDGQIAAGQASMTTSGSNLHINQHTLRLIINWQKFNIDPSEATHFNQPLGGIALNRVNPNFGPSQIYGALSATGMIILVNNAGIFFGPSAQVNVGGIIASTANITDRDFLDDNSYHFYGSGNQSIINHGQIIAEKNGLVALIGNNIENHGIIQAHLGQVALGTGNAFTIQFANNSLIEFKVDEGSLTDGRILNKGKISAHGGKILIAAKAASQVLDNAINMEGILQAKTVGVKNGVIILDANEGKVNVSGTITASGTRAGQKGGEIQVLGKRVNIAGNATLDASGDAAGGQIYLGGNAHGNGPLANADYTSIGPNVTIKANALNTGSGGKVVVWADKATQFYGHILAQGGLQSGDGGWVEVSGKNGLNFQGQVDTSANNGKMGTLLLDPKFLIVANGGLPYVDSINNEFNNLSSQTVYISPLSLALANANIILQANTDVIINSAIQLNCATCSLTIQAGRSVLINNNVLTHNGDIAITANDRNALANERMTTNVENPMGDNETLNGQIQMVASAILNAGLGDVHLTIDSQSSLPFSPGNMSLGRIAANNITATTPNSIIINGTLNAENSVNLRALEGALMLNNSITAKGSDYSIVLEDRTFLNNAGANALNPVNGNFLVWSSSPLNDTLGGITYHFKQYNANYATTTPLGTGNGFLYTIAPSITPNLVGSTQKVYNGNVIASLNATNYAFLGALGDDVITFNNPAFGVFDTKNVGTNKNVSVDNISILSAHNGSAVVYGYTLSTDTASNSIGIITPAVLTPGLTGVVSKTYDGTNLAHMTSGNYTLSGIISGDTVLLNNPFLGMYDHKNVGTNKLVTVGGLALSGADSSNYTLSSTTTSGSIGLILPALLNTHLQGEVTKTYDGTQAATLSEHHYALSGIVGTDQVSLSNFSNGSYDDKNVGTHKLITVTGLSLTGSDAGNYILIDHTVEGNMGTITPANLTISLTGSTTKVYDGNTNAQLTNSNYILSGIIGSDQVTLTHFNNGTYDNKNVGTNKLVSISNLDIAGTDANNYQLVSSDVSGNIGTITPAQLNVDLIGPISKVYDGTTAVTLTPEQYAVQGVIGNDNVTLNHYENGNFDTPDIGINKLVTVTDIALSGTDASNYTLAHTTLTNNEGVITGTSHPTDSTPTQPITPTTPPVSTNPPVDPGSSNGDNSKQDAIQGTTPSITQNNTNPSNQSVSITNTSTQASGIQNITFNNALNGIQSSALSTLSTFQENLHHALNKATLLNEKFKETYRFSNLSTTLNFFIFLLAAFMFILFLTDIKEYKRELQFLRLSFKLRTALNGILGYAKIIDGNKLGLIPNQQHQYLNHIMASSDQIFAELARVERKYIRSVNADMAFNLRTALNNIMGFAKLMATGKSGKLVKNEDKFLNNIYQSSHDILDLIPGGA